MRSVILKVSGKPYPLFDTIIKINDCRERASHLLTSTLPQTPWRYYKTISQRRLKVREDYKSEKLIHLSDAAVNSCPDRVLHVHTHLLTGGREGHQRVY